jgi:hypothetical protein
MARQFESAYRKLISGAGGTRLRHRCAKAERRLETKLAGELPAWFDGFSANGSVDQRPAAARK